MAVDYKLPLPVLRGYLGPSTLTEFESPRAEGLFHRAWRCGCIAQYRNSPHQTAVWRPCALHRSSLAAVAGAPVPRAPELGGDEPERRSGVNVCVIDSDLKVLYKSSGSEVEPLMGSIRGLIERVVADEAAAVAQVDANTVLRMMPLQGHPPHTFAVVLEGRRGSNRLMEVATRYHLTRRETEVLRLLLDHQSTKEIAERLCIAESTVADHFKSLFRKTDSKRRTELVTKIFEA